MVEENYFKALNKIEAPVEKKGPQKLNYISWADAWGKLKEVYPLAEYKVYEHPETKMPYFSDAAGGFVKVGVSIPVGKDENGTIYHDHIVHLPIMDNMNKSILKDKITTFDINKAIQRALAKAIAMHGMGLYVYRGEDFPEETNTQPSKKMEAINPSNGLECEHCHTTITDTIRKYSEAHCGGNVLCITCQKKYAAGEFEQLDEAEE